MNVLTLLVESPEIRIINLESHRHPCQVVDRYGPSVTGVEGLGSQPWARHRTGDGFVLRLVSRLGHAQAEHGSSRLAVELMVLAVVSALLLAACGGTRGSEPHTTATARGVVNLTSVSVLKARFTRDAGKVRLILLLSPT